MIWVAGMGKPCKQELNANTQTIQQKSGRDKFNNFDLFWKHMLAGSRRRDTSLLNQVVHACEWVTVRVRTTELCSTMFWQLGVFCNSPATQQDTLLTGHKWRLRTIGFDPDWNTWDLCSMPACPWSDQATKIHQLEQKQTSHGHKISAGMPQHVHVLWKGATCKRHGALILEVSLLYGASLQSKCGWKCQRAA